MWQCTYWHKNITVNCHMYIVYHQSFVNSYCDLHPFILLWKTGFSLDPWILSIYYILLFFCTKHQDKGLCISHLYIFPFYNYQKWSLRLRISKTRTTQDERITFFFSRTERSYRRPLPTFSELLESTKAPFCLDIVLSLLAVTEAEERAPFTVRSSTFIAPTFYILKIFFLSCSYVWHCLCNQTVGSSISLRWDRVPLIQSSGW